MQGKWSTYILLAAFISIWIIAGYRIYKAVHKDDDTEIFAQTRAIKNEPAIDDSFSLSLNFQDPFRLTQPSAGPRQASSYNSSQEKPVAVKQKPAATDFKPVGVVFKGMIENATAKRKVAIINMHNQDITLSEGERSDPIILTKIYNNDSIMILQGDHKLIIHR